MNRFWDEIICPLFTELNPRLVIEIGVDKGLNTKNILDYCYANNSKLISIDPTPNCDISMFKEEYGDNFEFISELSLQCLPSLNDYDIILIDGDHNWYTVFNELKSIEKNFNQESFPFVMLHDISWPYGRRDLYYNPEDIPNEYLHEFNQLGMAPDISGLLEVGGINFNFNNAIFENGPKNGVLTAIEDFLDETDLNLSFYKINGFNGLGLIYPKNENLDKLIDKILYKSNILEIVEKNYNNVVVALSQNKHQIAVLSEENSGLVSERDSLVERNAVLSEENSGLVSERDSLVERNVKLLSKEDSWQEYNNSLLDKINSLNRGNGELVSERDSLVERNAVLSEENSGLVSERDSLVEHISSLNHKQWELMESNSSLVSEKDLLNQRFNSLKNSKNDLTNDMLKLMDVNSNLKNANKRLLESNSWKVTAPFRKIFGYFRNK